MLRTRGTLLRLAMLALLSLSVVAAYPSAARACSCVRSTPQEMLARSDVVFVGRVVQVISLPGIEQYPTQATLEVQQLFKGPSQSEFIVLGGRGGGADCSVSFARDEEYLVYATDSGQGALQTSICQRTQLARDAQADLAALGEPITLNGGFRALWEQYGGLAIFGHPLTNEFLQNGMTVQYFERARFEWQPGTWPERYDVLLGRLGVEAAQLSDLRGSSVLQPAGSRPNGCTYYPETQHNLCGSFQAYWVEFGGLGLFGYPITDAFTDSSTGLTMQYFERARFELHPGAWPERHDILLGRLGAELLGLQ